MYQSKVFKACFTCSFAIIVLVIAGSLSADTLPEDRCWYLIQAVKKGDLELAKTLIAAGTNVNCQISMSPTALQAALWYHGSMDLVQTLLTAGADISMCDYNGVRPMQFAAENGNISIVKLFMEKGAVVNEVDSNKATILHYAALSTDTAMISYFLLHGASGMVNTKDKDDRTPLFYVLKPDFSKNTDSIAASIKLLLKNGAEINAQDSSKKTILHYCSLWFSSPIDQENDAFCAELVANLLRSRASSGICDNEGHSPYYYAKRNKLSKTASIFKHTGYNTKSDDLKVKQYLAEKRRKEVKKLTAWEVYTGASLLAVPFAYLGYSIYEREYRYKDNYAANNLRQRNNYATGLFLGASSGLLLGYLAREGSSGSSGMHFFDAEDFYPLWGLAAGCLIGHFMGKAFQRQRSNNPFLYYCAPVSLSITLPIILFTDN